MIPTVVSIGEVLWDLLPSGPKLGGAPANLAVHARNLGARSALISRVGSDDLGREALGLLREHDVDTRCVTTDPDRPTGTVGVELDAAGHARYEIHAPVAWDAIAEDATALELARGADALCFGSLAQRTPANRDTVQTLLAAARGARLRLCDINLREPFYDRPVVEHSLRLANALKLNETELPVLSGYFGGPATPDQQLDFLGRQFGLEMILLTLGSAGSRLWTPERILQEPGRSVNVADTVGAGDSFTAAFLVGTLLGWPPETTLSRATDIAAFVCTQAGATPRLPDPLLKPYRQAIAGVA